LHRGLELAGVGQNHECRARGGRPEVRKKVQGATVAQATSCDDRVRAKTGEGRARLGAVRGLDDDVAVRLQDTPQPSPDALVVLD
jgi:hypothetical protein